MVNECLIGVPGAGKTYVATHRLVKQLKRKFENRKHAKFAMSNYPVNHKKYGATFRFTKESMYLPLQNCFIVNDEAYQMFGQNNKKEYKLDAEIFFGTVRHSNVDTLHLAHGMTRINSDIRVKSETLWVVKKVCLPFPFERPIFFKLYGYADDGFLTNTTIEPYKKYPVLFRKEVASCYDTLFFKKEPFDMSRLPKWTEDSLINEDKPDMSKIINWDKKELDKFYKKKGFLTETEAEKLGRNGEVADWNNNIFEEKELKFIDY